MANYPYNYGGMQSPYQMNPYLQNQTPMPSQNQDQAKPVAIGINWEAGVEGANSLYLPPNTMAVILDSKNEGKMYIKISDSIGKCTLRYFNYSEILDPVMQSATTGGVDLSEYVKKSELQELLESMLGGGEKK